MKPSEYLFQVARNNTLWGVVGLIPLVGVQIFPTRVDLSLLIGVMISTGSVLAWLLALWASWFVMNCAEDTNCLSPDELPATESYLRKKVKQLQEELRDTEVCFDKAQDALAVEIEEVERLRTELRTLKKAS